MEQQAEEQVIIKLYLSKEHIRRFTIPKIASYEDLKSRIIQFYDEVGQTINPSEDLDLQYCDDDNEWTVLRNEDDWYCCKAICPTNIKIRKPSMWMKAQFTYKSGQQAVIQSFNKEKKYLVEKSKQIFSQVNEEFQKLSSNQEVKKLESTVSHAVNDFIETVTPLLQTATNTTCEFISSVENSLKTSASSSEPQLIRTDDVVEEPIDEEEEQLIAQQTVQPTVQGDTMEKSGYVWVLADNEKTQVVAQQQAEPVVETPIVEEPAVIETPEVVEPVAEEQPAAVVETIPEPVVETPVQFAEQMKMLSLMGFTDVQKNTELLTKHNGNLSLVVDALLAM